MISHIPRKVEIVLLKVRRNGEEYYRRRKQC
jgi:hypothetical protein